MTKMLAILSKLQRGSMYACGVVLESFIEKVDEGEEENTSPNLVEWCTYMYRKGIPKAKNTEEKLQLKILFWQGVALFVWSVVDSEGCMWYLNPWELSLWQWLVLFEIKQCALNKNNTFTRWAMVQQKFKILGYRETEQGKKDLKKMEKLTDFDYFYLGVNAILDMIYLSHLTKFIFTSEYVVGWEKYTFTNTIGSYLLLVVVIDSTYAVVHKAMHCVPLLYKGVHRHHHRITVPERNFVDVRNYHPLELILSSVAMFFSLHFCSWLVGATHLSVICAFLTTVVVNCINHSEFDIRIPLIGFDSGDHETHHRFPNKNMGMCCFLLDKYVFKSYKSYEGRE